MLLIIKSNNIISQKGKLNREKKNKKNKKNTNWYFYQLIGI